MQINYIHKPIIYLLFFHLVFIFFETSQASTITFDTVPHGTPLPFDGTYSECGMIVTSKSYNCSIRILANGNGTNWLRFYGGDQYIEFKMEDGSKLNLCSFDFLTNGYTNSRWLETSSGEFITLPGYTSVTTIPFSGPGYVGLEWFRVGTPGYWTYIDNIVFEGFYIRNHNPSGHKTQAINQVDIVFSQEINPVTFTSSDITFTGPNGSIAVNEPNYQGNNIWRVSFDTQNTLGEYHMYVGPHIEAPEGNEMDQDENGTGGEDPNDVYDAAFTIIYYTQNFALGFDGSDDRVEVADDGSLTPVSGLTISAWIYINDVSWIDRTAIACKYAALERAYLITLGKANDAEDKTSVGLLVSQTKDSFSGKWTYGTTQLQSGQWYHIAAAFEANHQAIYVNGIKETDDTDSVIADLIPNNDQPLYIGYDKTRDTYFNGILDEVRIWNYVLDVNQINENMNKVLTGNEAGLIGYWRFDEGQGQIAYDLSGNENDGQLGISAQVDNSDPCWITSDAPITDANVFTLFYSIDSGHHQISSGGDFELKAISGQPEHRIISGGIFTLTGGFLADLPGITPMCMDGIDNDNDGAIDFPNDVGCLHALDISELTADYNQDGKVDVRDVTLLAEHWLRYGYELDVAPEPDGDGIINFMDFAVMAQNWLEEINP
jgi:hypothetical protein